MVRRAMKRFLAKIFGGRLQIVLIASFSLVVALTIGLFAIVVSQLIEDYLTEAKNESVARDMALAESFYQLKKEEIQAVGYRMVRDPRVIENIPGMINQDPEALKIIDQEISRKITVPTLGGTHLILLLDTQGNIHQGRVLSADARLSSAFTEGNWGELAIVHEVISSTQERTATEILPGEFLSQVGLESQAYIPLINTAKATVHPFDSREGTAGLAIVGAYPFKDQENQFIGIVLTAYLFNNDFTLVDRIKEVAGIDTVTVFFGDLRISTNVLNENGTRAVGTRVSKEVYDVVLEQDKSYPGRAFVVNEWFITRYEPLHDFQGNVVGMLYVGAKESIFQALVHDFNTRVNLIALVSLFLAGIIAIPITRLVTTPIADLVQATRRLAEGDMSVHVQTYGNGELAVLVQSFNRMVETLVQTQQKLVHQERLASMGQLAAGVAHEINNPLGSILLIADVLHKETSKDDPHREDLEMILQESTRCKTIVADLLNFSRQQQVLTRKTDVHALIEKVIQELLKQSSFERVQILRQFNAEISTLHADPDQLQQVFTNLLNNAAEAIDGDGSITVITQAVDQEWIEIKISDTGIGIPEENLGKLFTPFFTTKALGKGTGLGLSIVYGIIKMHRGQIHVSSQMGEGTIITITLPTNLPIGQLSAKQDASDIIL
jgi:two-component system NtrC family sensor kinase